MQDDSPILNMFAQLHQANRVAGNLQDYQGRTPWQMKGIVVDNQDPLGLGRVKVTTASLGGRSQTDWLDRLIPGPMMAYPVPTIGDTVVVGFYDGDSHQGFYVGIVQNILNPAGQQDSHYLKVGDALVQVTPTAISLALGNASIVLQNGTITISGVTDVKINNKSVAVVGALDDDGDTLVNKGY